MPGDVAGVPFEWFDARDHPTGWGHDGFDDAAWSGAFEIMPMHTGAHGDPSPPSEPFGMLRPPVRLSGRTIVHLRRPRARPDGTVEIDSPVPVVRGRS